MFCRSSLGAFVAMPERRVRALTACGGQGRAALDELYGDPAFCVRHVGIRQGKNCLPATAAGTKRRTAPEITLAVGCFAAWPLEAVVRSWQLRARSALLRAAAVAPPRASGWRSKVSDIASAAVFFMAASLRPSASWNILVT